MKKISILLVILALCSLVLGGCGTSGSNTTPGPGPAESTQDTEIKTMTDGILTMATNAYFPPYDYYEGNEIQGIDVEIAKVIADRLGLELQIQNMDFDNIIPAIRKGKADIGLAGISITEDRAKKIDFSDSYATGIQSVIVTENSGISSIEDLQEKRIGVKIYTTGNYYASETFGEKNLVKYDEGKAAVADLSQGKIDALIIDNAPAETYVAETKGLKILNTDYVEEEYAACVSKKNPALLKAVNEVLTDMKEDGSLQAILDQYITAN